jgi:hypothetical protein
VLSASPIAARAAWDPCSRASCAEASQPAWHAAAPAAEASPVLRAFLGVRPAEPCLRLLKEGEQDQDTQKKTKTEVFSDTYLLRTKASRACREAPRAPAPAGAIEGCSDAGFGTASASDARGAERAACPGVVVARGPTSCTAGVGTCSRRAGRSA